MLLSPPNVVVASKFGPIIVNKNDSFIARDILRLGYWAEREIDMIAMLIRIILKNQNTALFYDVGANIGTHSLALSKMFSEKIKVRAFEAQRAIFDMLCGTMALNKIMNVECHLNAVGDVDGDVIDLYLPDYNLPNNFGGFELIKAKNSDNQDMVKSGACEKVRTVTLDSFDEKVNFVKIDIEGMEHIAIAGAIKTIDSGRPICLIEIIKTEKHIVLDFFRSRNYSLYEMEHNVIFIPNEIGINIEGLPRIV